jgi:hypothetical protein
MGVGEINSKFKIQNSKLNQKIGKDVALASCRIRHKGIGKTRGQGDKEINKTPNS